MLMFKKGIMDIIIMAVDNYNNANHLEFKFALINLLLILLSWYIEFLSENFYGNIHILSLASVLLD